jgi:hypothetical protein
VTEPSFALAAPLNEPGCINPAPAEWIAKGFRLLVLRCYHNESAPPSFACIKQQIFRTPERASRHGLHFGLAFRPEVMSWLIERLGRPSAADQNWPRRNPQWPTVAWRSVSRNWPDAVFTTEWYAEVIFFSQEHADAFGERWSKLLAGELDD